MAGVLGQRKSDRIIGRRVAGVQRCHDIDAWPAAQVEVSESSTVQARKRIRSKPSRTASSRDFSTSSLRVSIPTISPLPRSLKYIGRKG
jgi:hypothetical protein